MRQPKSKIEVTKQDVDPARNALSTDDWLKVAKDTLIQEGIEAVKIDRLAKACGVTRGGFYWRFKSRDDLLDQLLKDWRTSNTSPFLAAIAGPGSPAERYQALIRLWIDERDFNPDYDTAVRNWALTSRKVADVVHTVDDIRMDALRRLFLDSGYEENEAMVRARITYFHQIGYYALGMKEATPTRAGLVDIYYRILTGFDGPADSRQRASRKGNRD
jgi:AcrR family transcriptional regulator